MSDEWRPLKPILRGGYLTVNVSRAGKKSARRIHRLVLEAFVGPCPEGHIGCHGDGDPTNNRLENLRWGTHQANADDTLRHGRRKMGSASNAKLVEEDVLEIRRLRSEGVPTGALASRFGVSRGNIEAIVYRRSWRHLPCPRGAVAPSPPVCLGVKMHESEAGSRTSSIPWAIDLYGMDAGPLEPVDRHSDEMVEVPVAVVPDRRGREIDRKATGPWGDR
jgi:hypothetical protein